MKINKIIFLILLCVVSIFIFTNKSYADDFKDGDKVMFEKDSYHYLVDVIGTTVNWYRAPSEEAKKEPGISKGSVGIFRDWEKVQEEIKTRNADASDRINGLPVWSQDAGYGTLEAVNWIPYLPAQTDTSLCAVQCTDVTVEGVEFEYIVIVKKVNLTELTWIKVGGLVYRNAKFLLIDYYGDEIYEKDKVKEEVFEKIKNGEQNVFEEFQDNELEVTYVIFEETKKACIKEKLGKDKIETSMDRQRLETWLTEDDKQVIQMLDGTLKNIKNVGEKRGIDFSNIAPENRELAMKYIKEHIKETEEYIENETPDATNDVVESLDDQIYHQPDKKNPVTTAGTSIDGLIGKAEEFIESAKDGAIGSVEAIELQNFSAILYNILLSVGVATAVIVGAILGIKIMTAGVEEKAEVKELLIPYIVACVIIFGGFGIWKLVVEILSGI